MSCHTQQHPPPPPTTAPAPQPQPHPQRASMCNCYTPRTRSMGISVGVFVVRARSLLTRMMSFLSFFLPLYVNSTIGNHIIYFKSCVTTYDFFDNSFKKLS